MTSMCEVCGRRFTAARSAVRTCGGECRAALIAVGVARAHREGRAGPAPTPVPPVEARARGTVTRLDVSTCRRGHALAETGWTASDGVFRCRACWARPGDELWGRSWEPPPAGWEAQAECARVGADPDLFFDGRKEAAAREVCAVCPVRMECLSDALCAERWARPYDRHGVFGGLGPARRHEIAATSTNWGADITPPRRVRLAAEACASVVGRVA